MIDAIEWFFRNAGTVLAVGLSAALFLLWLVIKGLPEVGEVEMPAHDIGLLDDLGWIASQPEVFDDDTRLTAVRAKTRIQTLHALLDSEQDTTRFWRSRVYEALTDPARIVEVDERGPLLLAWGREPHRLTMWERVLVRLRLADAGSINVKYVLREARGGGK